MIAGMHRSGTSVAAQWLHTCGLKIGDTLLGPGIGNDDGHFEDADFLLLHQSLLRNKNLPETGLTDKVVAALTVTEKQQVQKIITSKSAKHNQWGWKEPRSSLFLNTYNQLLPDAFYFVVVRSYNDTVNSLVAREYKMQQEKISRKKGLHKLKWQWFKQKSMNRMLQEQTEYFLQIWINYYEHILAHLQTQPAESVLVTSCNSLLKKDEAVFCNLTQQWGLTLNYVPFKNVYKQQRLSAVNNIEPFVKDKAFVLKAAAIEDKLRLQFSAYL